MGQGQKTFVEEPSCFEGVTALDFELKVFFLCLLQYKMLNCCVVQGHYTEGAELIDSVLDVVRKEAEGCDCHLLNREFARDRLDNNFKMLCNHWRCN